MEYPWLKVWPTTGGNGLQSCKKVYKLIHEDDKCVSFEELLSNYETVSPSLKAEDLGAVTTEGLEKYHLFRFDYLKPHGHWTNAHFVNIIKKVAQLHQDNMVVGDLRLVSIIGMATGEVVLIDLE
eukprot:Selendium_serpulae@DN4577_c1_g1_i1.p1